MFSMSSPVSAEVSGLGGFRALALCTGPGPLLRTDQGWHAGVRVGLWVMGYPLVMTSYLKTVICTGFTY